MLYVTTSRDGQTIALHIVCPVCNCGIRMTDGALPPPHEVPMEFVMAVRERLEKECKHIGTYGGHYGDGTLH
jgi:hypothetical protein